MSSNVVHWSRQYTCTKEKSNLILNFPSDPHYHLKAERREKFSIAEVSCKLDEECDCFFLKTLESSQLLLLQTQRFDEKGR